MRRLLMVLAVAALMAAMMVSSGPAAVAQDSFGNESDFDNSYYVIEYDDNFYVYDDAWDDYYWDAYYWDDCYWWDGEYWCQVA